MIDGFEWMGSKLVTPDGLVGPDLRGPRGFPGAPGTGLDVKVTSSFTLQYGGLGQGVYDNNNYVSQYIGNRFTSFYVPFSVKLKEILLYTASYGVKIRIGLYKSSSKLNNAFNRIAYNTSDVTMNKYVFPVISGLDIVLEPGSYLFAWKVIGGTTLRSLLMRPLSSVGYPEVNPVLDGPNDFDGRDNLVYSNYMSTEFPSTIDLLNQSSVFKILHSLNEPRGMVPVFSLKCEPV